MQLTTQLPWKQYLQKKGINQSGDTWYKVGHLGLHDLKVESSLSHTCLHIPSSTHTHTHTHILQFLPCTVKKESAFNVIAPASLCNFQNYLNKTIGVCNISVQSNVMIYITYTCGC